MNNKRFLSLFAVIMAALIAVSCTGCGTDNSNKKSDTKATAASTAKSDGIDYMALVNKTHKLPDNWEKNLKTVTMTNSIKDKVEVEKKAYDAYLKLKADLEKEDIFVDLDSARRSVKEQQRIMDEFTEEYGADYAAKTVAKPGYSEHHTGLALDLYLIVDGKDVVENEDMIKYTDIWAKIHEKLADYGFILRYLDGAEHITGYGYEPWHIRYIDNVDKAKEITSKGTTFEEYLGTYTGGDVTVDYGKSEIFTEEELKEAVVQIKCQFAFWGNFELKNIRYAGDDAVIEKNSVYLDEDADDSDENNKKIAEFLMDFHTPKDVGELGFKADEDYTDYQWRLETTEDGEWEIVTSG